MVVMTPVGTGIRGSLYHSHSFESWATRLPGWKIVMPCNALDAYGLMLSAIVDPNPVMVLLPKALLRVRGEQQIPGEPDDEKELTRASTRPSATAATGSRVARRAAVFRAARRGALVREGDDVTVVSYGRRCRVRAGGRRAAGKACFDVIDLRSIFPYDWKAIAASVRKTGRLLSSTRTPR